MPPQPVMLAMKGPDQEFWEQLYAIAYQVLEGETGADIEEFAEHCALAADECLVQWRKRWQKSAEPVEWPAPAFAFPAPPPVTVEELMKASKDVEQAQSMLDGIKKLGEHMGKGMGEAYAAVALPQAEELLENSTNRLKYLQDAYEKQQAMPNIAAANDDTCPDQHDHHRCELPSGHGGLHQHGTELWSNASGDAA